MYGGVKLWIKLWYMYDKLCEFCWVWFMILIGFDGWFLWVFYGDGVGDLYVCFLVVFYFFYGKIFIVFGFLYFGFFFVRGNCLFFY